RTSGRAIGKSSTRSEKTVPRTGERVDDNDRNPRRVTNSSAEESFMRAAIAGVLLAACLAAGTTPAADPKPTDGWTDLMKPDVWKKGDPGWITTDAVKLDPEKMTRLKAEKKENGPVWVNGEKGRLPDLITKESYGDCEVHVEFLIAQRSNSGIKFHAV